MRKKLSPDPRPGHLDNEFRHVFRNLSYPDRYTKLNTDRWAQYCKKNGATTLFMDFRSAFYSYHPSDFIPRDPELGDRDLAAELAAAAKKHDLKFCAYIPPTGIESLEHGHDDWQSRTADGSKECKNWGFWRTVFCYNTGFKKIFAGNLHEISEKYHPHGFFIDGVIYGFSACYCKTCKAMFRKETGKDMPEKPDWNSKLWYDYVDWRYRQVEAVGKMIGDAIHSVDPKISIVWNCGYPSTGWEAAQSPAQGQWMDYACSEMLPSGTWGGMFMNGYTYAEELGWMMTLNRAVKYGKWGNHYTYFPPSIQKAEIITTANTSCAFGAQGCAQEHTKHLAEYLGRIKEAEPWMIDSESAADTALHYSVLAQNSYYRPNDHGEIHRCLLDCRGVFKALVNNHTPVEAITDEWIENYDISRFRAIILPNSATLTAKAVSALKEFVKDGGNLIASMETGLRDKYGKRVGRELLWKGSGLSFVKELPVFNEEPAVWHPDKNPELKYGLTSSPDQFLLFASKTDMKKWIGEDITMDGRPEVFERREINQFIETPSVHFAAKAILVAADRNWKTILSMRFRLDRKTGFKEGPAVLQRSFGKGKITYVNFQFGEQAASLVSGIIGTGGPHPWWRHFIGTLLETAAGKPRIRVEAPTCVKMTVWKQPKLKRFAIHVFNELSSLGVQNIQREDLIPVPVKIEISLPGIKSVKAVVGGENAKVSRCGNKWFVDLKQLQERVILECK